MFDRLIRNWVYGGFLAGLLLLGLTWLLAQDWPVWLTAIWILLPVYMIHQYEEHDADRFRIFMNRYMTGGREALTPLAVFIINVPGVWGVIVLSFALAWSVRPGLGFIAIYLVLVNAVGHIAAAIVMRRYHPGLGTAILLFLPVGILALLIVQSTAPSQVDHLIGLGVGVAIHAVIVLWVRRGKFAKQ
jgi:Protein of unknown function with HXXEE motif